MNIAVFGITGQTGNYFLTQALAKGHTLRALVRTPEKLVETEGVVKITGSAQDLERVRETIRGSDVVVSLLGHVKGSPDNLLVESFQNILQAMEKEKVSRLVILTGAAVENPKDNPKLVDKIFKFAMGTFAKTILTDAQNAASLVQQSSVKWTIVRAPRLTNGAATGEVKIGYLGDSGISTQITRADLAAKVLEISEGEEWMGELPAVSN